MKKKKQQKKRPPKTFKLYKRRGRGRCPVCKKTRFKLVDFEFDKASGMYVDIIRCRTCKKVFKLKLAYLKDSPPDPNARQSQLFTREKRYIKKLLKKRKQKFIRLSVEDKECRKYYHEYTTPQITKKI